MKITKLGHCCLLIEIKEKKILTDPGSYIVEDHSKLTGLDFVLFTHEHQDHYHLESLKVILQYNPGIKIYANVSVGELLAKENISHQVIKHGDTVMLGEISVVGIGEKHALMHHSVPLASNTGYFIDGRLWYPGDAFTNPERPVEILALPSAGPWMKISEAIDYAILLKPKATFPVHDNGLSNFTNFFLDKVLSANGLNFVPMIAGGVGDF